MVEKKLTLCKVLLFFVCSFVCFIQGVFNSVWMYHRKGRAIWASEDLGRPWSQPLPQAISAIGSDQAAQDLMQLQCETPKDWDSPAFLVLSLITGVSRWGKGFSLSPVWDSHVSICATASHHPAMHHCQEHACVSSIRSCPLQAGRGCYWVPLKPLAEPTLVPQSLLAGQELQFHRFQGLFWKPVIFTNVPPVSQSLKQGSSGLEWPRQYEVTRKVRQCRSFK